MNISILLVEDEKDLQENIKDILEIHEFKVMTADNGVIALQLLEEEIFDIVVSDVMMPEMDGFELLSKVRNDKKLINLPFLFLTAKVEKDDVRKGMEYGAEDYLTKPVHAKHLINAIHVAIKKKKSRETWLSEKIEEVLNEERNVKYHELRTPLFGLMSILELVTTSLEAFDYVQLKEILDTAYDSSKRLNVSLMNLARFNGLGTYVSNKSDIVSVKDILYQIVSARKAEFEFLSEHDFSCHFDLDVLKFILQELIVNANKFCSEGPIYISLNKKSLVVANQQDFIMSPQDFEIAPFGQVNRKYYEQQGLGLGLYLSKVYATKNDARLSARISDDLKFIVQIDFDN